MVKILYYFTNILKFDYYLLNVMCRKKDRLTKVWRCPKVILVELVCEKKLKKNKYTKVRISN